jgi:TonB family protein
MADKSALRKTRLYRCYPAILILALAVTGWTQEPQPATTPQTTDQPVAKVGNGVSAPMLISKVGAEYSDYARRKRIEGICMVRLIVDADGVPQHMSVVRCVDTSLEEPSLEAVRQYRFKPAIRKTDGKPIPITMAVEISYRLQDGRPPRAGLCEDRVTSGSPIRSSGSPPPDAGDAQPNSNGLYALTKEMAAPRPREISDQGFCKAARAMKEDVGCIGTVDLDDKGKVLRVESMQCTAAKVEEPLTKSLEKSQFEPAYLNGNHVPVRFAFSIKYFVNPPKQ